MIHPDTELRFIDPEIGYGVFATRKIPKGTIAWARDIFDLEFTPGQVNEFDPIHAALISKYAYRNHVGNFILCWDFGRYVNHSFHSNLMSTGYDFEIAIRDIAAGEELTDDYGYLNVSTPFKARTEDIDRKLVLPDDIIRYHQQWDKIVEKCLPLLFQVDQPLLPLIADNDLAEIKATIAGKREMKSIRSHFFEGEGED